jgi:hypothetical protein
MNWLERARREMRRGRQGGTANTAKTPATAVTAVGDEDIRRDSTATLREAWEERAAIMQFDGGMSREEAERAAWELVSGNYRLH